MNGNTWWKRYSTCQLKRPIAFEISPRKREDLWVSLCLHSLSTFVRRHNKVLRNQSSYHAASSVIKPWPLQARNPSQLPDSAPALFSAPSPPPRKLHSMEFMIENVMEKFILWVLDWCLSYFISLFLCIKPLQSIWPIGCLFTYR